MSARVEVVGVVDMQRLERCAQKAWGAEVVKLPRNERASY